MSDPTDFPPPTFDLIPEGEYRAVITGTEVKAGPKGPYINVESTIHDDEAGLTGRKVLGISSFSDKALSMPGGPANLVQSVKDQLGPIPTDIGAAALPGWVAEHVRTLCVMVEVEHEQVERNGVPQTNPDGSPELSAKVRSYGEADADFILRIDKES